MTQRPVPRQVVVIGTGLIGTSAALALRRHGVDVWLWDRDPAAAVLAADLGAGRVLASLEGPERTGSRDAAGSPGNPAGPADVALIAVPPAAEAVSEKACWARTIGSLGESTAADTVRVIQCSKERFQNR